MRIATGTGARTAREIAASLREAPFRAALAVSVLIHVVIFFTLKLDPPGGGRRALPAMRLQIIRVLPEAEVAALLPSPGPAAPVRAAAPGPPRPVAAATAAAAGATSARVEVPSPPAPAIAPPATAAPPLAAPAQPAAQVAAAPEEAPAPAPAEQSAAAAPDPGEALGTPSREPAPLLSGSRASEPSAAGVAEAVGTATPGAAAPVAAPGAGDGGGSAPVGAPRGAPGSASPASAAAAGPAAAQPAQDPAALVALRRRIDARKVYPQIAVRNGWEGRVLVEMRLAEDGRLAALQLLEGSGYAVLDEATLAAVRRAAPFPPVAGPITVPVEYRLTP